MGKILISVWNISWIILRATRFTLIIALTQRFTIVKFKNTVFIRIMRSDFLAKYTEFVHIYIYIYR